MNFGKELGTAELDSYPVTLQNLHITIPCAVGNWPCTQILAALHRFGMAHCSKNLMKAKYISLAPVIMCTGLNMKSALPMSQSTQLVGIRTSPYRPCLLSSPPTSFPWRQWLLFHKHLDFQWEQKVVDSMRCILGFRTHLLTGGGYKFEKKRVPQLCAISLVDVDVKQGQFNI